MINIALLQPKEITQWEKGEIKRISKLVNNTIEINLFNLVDDFAYADLIVLLDTCSFKTQKNIDDFESLLSFNKDDKRVFTLNYEDSPPGFLPGLYSSLESFKFDPSIHLSWPHLSLPNELVYKNSTSENQELTTLFTFSGSCSHPLRRKIFDFYKNNSNKYKIKEVKKWYNHTKEEKESYITDIRQSKFVLCPKGVASYSHRIVETLAMGKVPVIIADDWVPFSIPEKEYYLKVREKDILNLIQILEEKENNYEQLQVNATTVYNKYFNPSHCYSIALNQLCNLYTNQLTTTTSDILIKRWHSRTFWKNNKWCIEDRIVRKINKTLKSIRNILKILFKSKLLYLVLTFH